MIHVDISEKHNPVLICDYGMCANKVIFLQNHTLNLSYGLSLVLM